MLRCLLRCRLESSKFDDLPQPELPTVHSLISFSFHFVCTPFCTCIHEQPCNPILLPLKRLEGDNWHETSPQREWLRARTCLKKYMKELPRNLQDFLILTLRRSKAFTLSWSTLGTRHSHGDLLRPTVFLSLVSDFGCWQPLNLCLLTVAFGCGGPLFRI